MASDFDINTFLAEDNARMNEDPAIKRGRAQVRTSVSAAPDAAASQARLAERYGVPVAAVAADPKMWSEREANDNAQGIIDQNPKLGAWMGQPGRAAMAHDDVEPLSAVEQTFKAHGMKRPDFNMGDAYARRGITRPNFGGPSTQPGWFDGFTWGNVGRAVQRGFAQFNEGAAGLLLAASETQNAIGDALIPGALQGPEDLQRNTLKSISDYIAGQRADQQMLTRAGPAQGTVTQGLLSGVSSLPQSVAALALGLAGAPLAGAGMLGASTGGQAYGQARSEGLGVGQSLAFGTGQGLIETGTEMIPLEHLVQGIKVGKPFLNRLARNFVEENIGEQVATFGQDFNEWAALPENKDKTLGDFIAARPAAALQTALATAVGAGTVNTAVEATMQAHALLQRRTQAAEAAPVNEAMLKQLQAIGEASKLKQRDVSSFENWVKAAADGTEATHVYVDANTLVETLQQSGLSEPEIIAALPSLTQTLGPALQSNGDVQIPIEEFAARSGELGAALVPHLRIDPADMSTTEAATFMQGAQEELQSTADRIFEEAGSKDEFRASTERVRDAVLAKLDAVNRFTGDVNNAYAMMHANFWAQMAVDTGVTPEEAAAQYPLDIRAESIADGAQVMDQAPVSGPYLLPAIRHKGKIYKSVADHMSALSQIEDPVERQKAMLDGDNRVYVTEKGKVLNRFRAQEYAVANGLIRDTAPSWAATSPDLISENLSRVEVDDNGRPYMPPQEPSTDRYNQDGAPIFYSALAKAISESKTGKAPAAQWKATLQNAPGVKQEELEWSGLLEMLDFDPKAVLTREELSAAVEAGGIKIEEVVLGEGAGSRISAAEVDELAGQYHAMRVDGLVDQGYEEEEANDIANSEYGTFQDQAETELEQEEPTADVQFKDWSSDPSADSYRELLLTLPIGQGGNPDRAPSTHWDQPAVVAHVRFMEKRDASGNRVLFIEEVQSDWLQKLRDQGPSASPADNISNNFQTIVEGMKAAGVLTEVCD